MKIRLLVIGKTGASYLKDGIDDYCSRISRYCDFEMEVIPDVKNRAVLPVEQLKTAESEQVLRRINKSERLVLLDENGKEERSEGLAKWIIKCQVGGVTSITFVIGGAYGFGKGLYERADLQLSLSKMTFSHQMVRLIFLEQLYRAFTIIRNEPYHHS